jgi:LemA protein
MLVEEDDDYNKQEVDCNDFHLIGERKPPKQSINNIVKEKVVKLSKPAIVTAVILGAFLFFGLWFAGNYNSLVVASNGVDNSWSKVETQYQRRLDLIDNVVASVKGSQLQEQKVFGDIAKARTQYNQANSAEGKAEAANSIETNVALIPRLQEAYPELKSNEQVTKLIAELAGTENGILDVRNRYNDAVTNYNNNITRFPKNIFAGLFNYDKRTLFKSDVAASKAPTVNFSN